MPPVGFFLKLEKPPSPHLGLASHGHPTFSPTSSAQPLPPLLSPKRRPYSCSQYLCVVEYEVDLQGVVQSPPTASTWGSPTKGMPLGAVWWGGWKAPARILL